MGLREVLERKRLKEEQQIKEKEQAQQEQKQKQEDQQRKIDVFALEDLVDVFIRRLEEVTPEKVLADQEEKFFKLYTVLEQVLGKTSKLSIADRLEILPDYLRVKHIKSIAYLYAEQIEHIKRDKFLSKEHREAVIAELERDRRRQLSNEEEEQ